MPRPGPATLGQGHRAAPTRVEHLVGGGAALADARRDAEAAQRRAGDHQCRGCGHASSPSTAATRSRWPTSYWGNPSG